MTPICSCLFDLRFPDEAGLDLFLEPVRVSLDVDGCRVVKYPIEDGQDEPKGSMVQTFTW